MPKIQLTLLAGILGLFVCLGTGCCPKGMGQFTININATPDLKERVTVDVVAVSETQYQKWYNMPMNDYAKSAYRADAMSKQIVFSQVLDPNTRSFTIQPTDPIYKKWADLGGTPRLFILTDLNPRAVNPQIPGPGTADFRRQILPLEKCAWPEGKINVSVSPGDLTVTPDPVSEYNVK